MTVRDDFRAREGLLPSVVEAMAATPLVALDRLTAGVEGRILAKLDYLLPGFSKKDRELNITRIGFVASEITKNGGIAICAPIAPYEESRQANRELISCYGGYVEI